MSQITLTTIQRAMNEDLRESGITTSAQRKKMAVKAILPKEMERLTGYKIPGYSLAYFDDAGKANGYSRIKFLAPVPGNDKQKYWQPSGTRPKLYLSPFQHWEAIRTDPAIKIYITEGEKKAACACKLGLPTIGLGGVYNWLMDGEPIHELYTDFVLVQGREVVLVFDSDIVRKEEVRQALRRLETYLSNKGAIVYIKFLPDMKGHDKIGLDDYLLARGVADFNKIPERLLDDPLFDDFGVHPAIPRMNRDHAFLLNTGKATFASIVPDPEDLSRKTIVLSARNDLRDMYANQFVKVNSGDGDKKRINKFEYWLKHPGRRDATRLWMNPRRPFGFDPITRELNLWQGFAFVPRKPDKNHSWSLLRTHISEIIANGDKRIADYLLNWMAFGVQRPAERTDVAVVLRSGEGTGKGTLWSAYGKLFGPHYYHVLTKDGLVGRFNQMHANKVFIFADEALFAGDHTAANILKTMITEPTMTIEGKYQNAFNLPNYRKFAMASNEFWTVPAGPDSRRFAVFDISEAHKNDTQYFQRLRNQLENGGYEAMLYELMRRDLSSFVVWDYPKTDALLDQQKLTWNPIWNWWFEVLCAGTFGFDPDGKWEGSIWTSEARFQIMNSHQSRYDDEHRLATKLGMAFKKISPSHSRERVVHPKKKKQEYRYAFSSIAKCRREFEKAIQRNIDWETGRLKL